MIKKHKKKYYVAKESEIKIVRSKLLLKHGRTCDSCEYHDHNSRGSLAYDFHGSDEKCLTGRERGLPAAYYKIPETRVCDRWALVEMVVTPILDNRV